MKRIVIIGGGITGLATAHEILRRAGESGEQFDVRLLEASSQVGGIVQTEEHDGFLLERGPDSFISEKPAALELAKHLGLESQLIQTKPTHRRSFVVSRGKLLPVPEGFHLLAPARLGPFLKSKIFSWPGKARMMMDLMKPRRNGQGQEDESLADFVRRRLGREALARMAQPMVGGIYTADPELLSLRATMPRFLEMERQHRSLILALRRQVNSKVADEASGARYSLFLSFARGMQVLTDTLGKSIAACRLPFDDGAESSRDVIQLGALVDSLMLARESSDQQLRWHVRTNNGQTMVADAICLAVPSFISARLLRKVDSQLSAELDKITYASTGTINLGFNRDDIPHPLDGFGFVVPFSEKRTAMACTFSSQKFAGRAPDGRVLLRVFVGGALQPEVVELDTGEMLTRIRADLRDLLGITRAPLFTKASIWRHSMPQYHLGHVERVKRIEELVAKLPGLALAGNGYSAPGIPDCIRSGQIAASKLVNSPQSGVNSLC